MMLSSASTVGKTQKGQVLSAGLYAIVFKSSYKNAETLVVL